MASHLESLPPEVLDNTLPLLGEPQPSRLSQCNKQLQHRIESSLYKRAKVCQRGYSRAIFWACENGVDATVRKAALYGCGPFPQHRVGQCCLHDAVKRCQPETFKLLLDMGSRMRSQVCAPEVRESVIYEDAKTLRRISSRTRVDFMKILLESDTISHFNGHALTDLFLIRVVRDYRVSLDTVQYLLKLGADPFRAQCLGGGTTCPLAAVILTGASQIFHLLLDHGASIYGKHFQPGRQLISHIPIFAAACLLPSRGTSEVVKCLQNGAMVNHCAPVLSQGTRRKFGRQPTYKHYTPLPIYVYLDSIENWGAVQILKPIEGVKFWLDSGVSLNKGIPVHSGQIPDEYRRIPLRSMIYLLVDKWDIKKISEDGFCELIRFLSSFGTPHEDALVLCKLYNQISGTQSTLIRKRWEEILSILGFSM